MLENTTGIGFNSLALTKSGSGTLVLSGANTYSGVTTISAGGLQTNAANTIPQSSAVTNNAWLLLNGFNQSLGSLAGTTAATSSLIIENGTASVTLTIGNNNTSTSYLGGIFDDTGTLNVTKVGLGTQTITTAALGNVYFGQTLISGGSLTASTANTMPFLSQVSVASGATFTPTTGQSIGSLTGAGNVAITAGVTLIVGNDNTSPAAFSGIISTGTAALTKVGTGTLTLANTAAQVNSYSGATSVAGGTLALDYSNFTSGYTNLISPSSPLTLGSASLSVKGNATNASSQTFASLSLAGGAAMTITNAGGTTVFVNTITRAVGTAVDFSSTAAPSVPRTPMSTPTASSAVGPPSAAARIGPSAPGTVRSPAISRRWALTPATPGPPPTTPQSPVSRTAIRSLWVPPQTASNSTTARRATP